MEKLDFELEKYYPNPQILEETFSCIVSVFGIVYWLRRLNMKEKAEIPKIDLEKRGPKSAQFVEKVLQKDDYPRVIYHETVVRIRKWIEDLIGPIK